MTVIRKNVQKNKKISKRVDYEVFFSYNETKDEIYPSKMKCMKFIILHFVRMYEKNVFSIYFEEE